METSVSNRLMALTSAIKARWGSLLRNEMGASRSPSAVITPDMLILMLDETLLRLFKRVEEHAKTGASLRLPKRRQRKKTACRCGLHLLFNYYLAGTRALREVLPREFGRDRVLVCHCLNLLAHEEIEGLALLCQFRGSPTCSLLPTKAETAAITA